jgi:U3 small nucleolar RNA-associated protein 22
MAKSSKRAASSSITQSTNSNKKARKGVAVQPEEEIDQVEEVSSEDYEDSEGDFEDLEGGGSEDEFAAISDKGKGKALSDEFEEDEEISELGEMGESGSDDEDMIGDDDEDLYADLDGAAGEMDDEEEEEEDFDENSSSQGSADEDDHDQEMDIPIQSTSVAEPTKADRRKAKQPKPLTPAELRALAFAELTASPISNVLATQVAATLDPATPPSPSTSPLQPLLKSVHSHFTNLPKQKSVSLEKLRKKGTIVPEVQGADVKWLKMDLDFEKPRSEDVRIVGKWAWGGGLKERGEYVVDLAVAMPPVSSPTNLFLRWNYPLNLPQFDRRCFNRRITFSLDSSLNRLTTSSPSLLTFPRHSVPSLALTLLSRAVKVTLSTSDHRHRKEVKKSV